MVPILQNDEYVRYMGFRIAIRQLRPEIVVQILVVLMSAQPKQ